GRLDPRPGGTRRRAPVALRAGTTRYHRHRALGRRAGAVPTPGLTQDRLPDASMNRLVLATTLRFSTCAGLAQERRALPTVEVLGRQEEAIGVSDAASQGAFTRQDIESRPLLRPGELLEGMPGMIATQHSGEGKANQLFLRGYNLDHGTDFAT